MQSEAIDARGVVELDVSDVEFLIELYVLAMENIRKRLSEDRRDRSLMPSYAHFKISSKQRSWFRILGRPWTCGAFVRTTNPHLCPKGMDDLGILVINAHRCFAFLSIDLDPIKSATLIELLSRLCNEYLSVITRINSKKLKTLKNPLSIWCHESPMYLWWYW